LLKEPFITPVVTENNSRLGTYTSAGIRSGTLVGDADANAYELLFSFASSEGK
jgi:hypothetical protein